MDGNQKGKRRGRSRKKMRAFLAKFPSFEVMQIIKREREGGRWVGQMTREDTLETLCGILSGSVLIGPRPLRRIRGLNNRRVVEESAGVVA